MSELTALHFRATGLLVLSFNDGLPVFHNRSKHPALYDRVCFGLRFSRSLPELQGKTRILTNDPLFETAFRLFFKIHLARSYEWREYASLESGRTPIAS